MEDDEVKLVRVPVRELKVAMDGVRAALDENRRLAVELGQVEEEVRELELNLLKRQHQLDVCTGTRADHRPYRPGELSRPTQPKRPRPKSEMFSSAGSMRNLIGEQAETLNQLTEREENVSFGEALDRFRC
ncbi:hypothetical protein DVH05_013590 [Phytophthora capsici]|nr:hypothetical protein DVH05_013590 [Phytophthora capsici]